MIAQEFLVADPVFADLLEYVRDHDTRFAAATGPVPDGWQRIERGPWVSLRRDQVRAPAQGWKIHVTGTPGNADDVVAAAFDYCVAHDIGFKFLRSREIFRMLNSKQASRTSSGKLVTIYPAGEDQLRRTLTELGDRLAGYQGPYVLSDLRWADGPLYVRYGGFRERYCFGPDGDYVLAVERPDGQLVPDARTPVFQVPPWAPVPEFIAAQQRAGSAGEPFPYRVTKALHFSNGGGVYRAVEPDSGREVVLREARPHAGLDNQGDAVARLEHEYAMLTRLRGLDFVPEVFGLRTHWEHRFLVEEYIEGDSLLWTIVRRNPLFYADPADADIAGYTRWALDVSERLGRALDLLHARGFVFGDLQPNNVIVRPDGRICLIDFETAFHEDDDYRPTLATPGFSAPWARSATEIDDYALHCLRLAMFLPVTPLLRLTPGKPDLLVDTVADRFPVGPDFVEPLRAGLRQPDTGTADGWPVEEPEDWQPILDSMRDAILASASPDRHDRLFPGDPRQFDHHGIGIAFGAAGVLHALHVTGDVRPEHVDWLVRATERAAWPRFGLYDGLAGVAFVLDELGRTDDARQLVDRLCGAELHGCGAGLFGGLAGIGLTLLHFAGSIGDDKLTDRALRIADQLTGQLADGPAATVTRPGLMHGWSGPAVLFTRLFAHTGDVRQLDRAETALTSDLSHCGVPRPGNLQVRRDRDWLVDLEHGTAGIGIALHEFLGYRPDDHLARLRDRIHDSLAVELVTSAGLLSGRAGLLTSLNHLGVRPDVRALHLRLLGQHAGRFRDRLAFCLEGSHRLSMDLATGTAGVLLAVHGGHLPLPGPR
jgi:hypothetical protein